MRPLVAAALVFTLMAPRPVSAESTYDNGGRAILIGAIIGATIGIIIRLATAGPSASSAKSIHATLDPWIGGDVTALIGKWGAPTSTFQVPDGKSIMYTWIYQGGIVVRGGAFGTTARATPSSCRFDWTTTANRIDSYRWEGSCRVTDGAMR